MSSGPHLTTPRHRAQDVLQLPPGAPSPSYRLTARPESSSWPPPPPCWSRSGGGQDRRTDERKTFQSFFLCCMHAENEINLQTCTAGTSSKAWMKSSSSTAPAPEPSLPTDSRHETCSKLHVTTTTRCRTLVCGGGSDLQTCWRQRTDVEMSPCSPPSFRTARLLWMKTKSGPHPLSHRPRSFYLEEKQRTLVT